jgi:hypothetical protein
MTTHGDQRIARWTQQRAKLRDELEAIEDGRISAAGDGIRPEAKEPQCRELRDRIAQYDDLIAGLLPSPAI